MSSQTVPQLDREEYIEQAYFFRAFRERLENNTPAQEILAGLKEEILATTKLPMAIDFLLGEVQLNGRIGDGMARLAHYFSPFQTFILQTAEADKTRFDFRIALEILEREAEFRGHDEFRIAALFVFQFECLARNRLGYDRGMLAIAQDRIYPEEWQTWIQKIRFDLGTVDFADLIYLRSEQHVEDIRKRRREPDYTTSYPILFDRNAGRIAKANQRKDPLYMFAALQRQLGYPAVPRQKAQDKQTTLHPQIEARLQRLEMRLALLEQEQEGGIDLTDFYENGGKFKDDPELL